MRGETSDLEELQDRWPSSSAVTGELGRGVTLADLGADHEDMVELAWALGEAIGEEIDESELSGRSHSSVSCGASSATKQKTQNCKP
ncbi:MAG: hypothetical protein ACLUFT_09930 [Gemmiger formicilis]|uniref:hypothetical protein n=1 Tax=Gemmiger formicilis TaxID=745368 RepID=UPI0039962429